MNADCKNESIFDATKKALHAELEADPSIKEAQMLLNLIDNTPDWAKDAGDAILRGTAYVTGETFGNSCTKQHER